MELELHPGINDLEEMRYLDQEAYTQEFQVDESVGLSWYAKNPDIFVVIKEGGHVLGYTALIPVTSSCFELFKAGQLKDPDLKEPDILAYNTPGQYDLYFCSVVIGKEHRKRPGILKALISGIFSRLLVLYRERGIVVRRIVADTVSSGGSKFAELFGMKEICQSNHGSIVYAIDLESGFSFLVPEAKEYWEEVIKKREE